MATTWALNRSKPQHRLLLHQQPPPHRQHRECNMALRARIASILGGEKKQSKTKRLIRAAGHELKVQPPKILAKTRRKSGAKRANKQRIAIMLSKARAAGANIPEKK